MPTPAKPSPWVGIRNSTDYSPFGVSLDGRTAEGDFYRYGFQNQEKDDELKGNSKSLNYEFRMYDPTVGRFFAVDPLSWKHSYITPYNFSGNSPIALVDWKGLEKSDPDEIASANKEIDKFSKKKKTKSVWKEISKKDFVSSLRSMINDPESINQAQTNLCGVAVACKVGIEYNPEEFVKMAISLYENGYYEANGKTYRSNSSLFNSKDLSGLNAASFVVMTTMRESLNSFFSYDPNNDSGVSGYTNPSDVDKILKIFEITAKTSSDFKDGKGNANNLIKGINNAFKSNHAVIATVNYSEFSGKSSWSLIPDHFIQIESLRSDKKGNVTIEYWTWGESGYKITMTKENFYESMYFIGSY